MGPFPVGCASKTCDCVTSDGWVGKFAVNLLVFSRALKALFACCPMAKLLVSKPSPERSRSE